VRDSKHVQHHRSDIHDESSNEKTEALHDETRIKIIIELLTHIHSNTVRHECDSLIRQKKNLKTDEHEEDSRKKTRFLQFTQVTIESENRCLRR
jgi:hypothetical protein